MHCIALHEEEWITNTGRFRYVLLCRDGSPESANAGRVGVFVLDIRREERNRREWNCFIDRTWLACLAGWLVVVFVLVLWFPGTLDTSTGRKQERGRPNDISINHSTAIPTDQLRKPEVAGWGQPATVDYLT